MGKTNLGMDRRKFSCSAAL